jgi:CTP:molybdopterin cytidylyltransferase MocA
VSEGRYQTEAEAVEIDVGLRRLLEDLKLSVIESDPDEAKLLDVFHTIKGKL